MNLKDELASLGVCMAIIVIGSLIDVLYKHILGWNSDSISVAALLISVDVWFRQRAADREGRFK